MGLGAEQQQDRQERSESTGSGVLRTNKELVAQAIHETSEKLGKDKYYSEKFGEAVKKRLAELQNEELKIGFALARESQNKVAELEKKVDLVEKRASNAEDITNLTQRAIETISLPIIPEEKKNTNEQDSKSESNVSSSKTVTSSAVINLSIKSENGSFRSATSTVSIDSSGNLQVLDKSRGENAVKDLSKDFTALYLGSDNVLRDQNGKVVEKLGNATGGNIAASFVTSRMIDRTSLNSKGLSGVTSNYLNHLQYEGRQVIFVKGDPPLKSLTINSAASTETASTGAVSESAKTKESGSSKSSKQSLSQNIQTLPWFKHTYHEKVNGCWHQKTCYLREVREGDRSRLQVYMGKNSKGEEVWQDSKNVPNLNFEIVRVDKNTGSMKVNGSSHEIKSFDTLSKRGLTANHVAKLLNDNSSSLKDNYVNELVINGKRPVFIRQ